MDPELVSKAIAYQAYYPIQLARLAGEIDLNTRYLQAANAIAVGSLVANIAGMSAGDTFLNRVGIVDVVNATTYTATALDDTTELTLPKAGTYAVVMSLV
jgi:hypothetical protein